MTASMTSAPARTNARVASGAGGVVLLYHRVRQLDFDPQLLAVTPAHFAEHLEVLSRVAQPMSLRDLVVRLGSGSSATHRVALTFDDGYADNLHAAGPLLERFAVPATVFVTSGYVDGDREYWWDELERLVFRSRVLPARLRLTIDGLSFGFDLDAASASPVIVDGNWNVTCAHDPTMRHRLYRALFDRLRPLPSEVRERTLSDLRAWCGLPRRVRDSHRPLSGDELRRLHGHGIVDVGAHTVTHPVLSSLSAPDQAFEIIESKRALEAWIGQPVSSFSYPFGTRRDYTNDAVRAVRESGFEIACANVPGVATPRSDRLQLPRVLVRDWDGDTFTKKLREVGVAV